MSVKILGTGSYIPRREVLNEELSQFPPAALALIEPKTGVRARRFADDTEFTSDLAAQAAMACLRTAQFRSEDLDAIVLATSSPDRIQPATATRVQFLIRASNAFAFDINSVCSGAIFAIETARSLITAGSARSVLVVAAELYSRILNPNDFSTYPYFGDGAAAILLAHSDRPSAIIRTLLRSDGTDCDVIQIPAGGSMQPYSAMVDPRQQFFAMAGRQVYQFAVEKGSEIILQLLDAMNMSPRDIDYVIPHQANINIIKSIANNTGIPMGKFVTTLEYCGNTAAASVLLTLDHLYTSGESTAGKVAILVTFGGGLSWAASALRL